MSDYKWFQKWESSKSLKDKSIVFQFIFKQIYYDDDNDFNRRRFPDDEVDLLPQANTPAEEESL